MTFKDKVLTLTKRWNCSLLDETVIIAGVFFIGGLVWHIHTQNERIHDLISANSETVAEYSRHINDLNSELSRSISEGKERTERITSLQLTLESMQNSINALTLTIDEQQARIQKLLKGKK